MKKTTKTIIVIVVILFVIGGFVLLRRNANKEVSNNLTNSNTINNTISAQENTDISSSTADLQMMTRALSKAEEMKKYIEKEPDSYDEEAIQEFETAHKELLNFEASHNGAYKLDEQDKIDELTNKLIEAINRLQDN